MCVWWQTLNMSNGEVWSSDEAGELDRLLVGKSVDLASKEVLPDSSSQLSLSLESIGDLSDLSSESSEKCNSESLANKCQSKWPKNIFLLKESLVRLFNGKMRSPSIDAIKESRMQLDSAVNVVRTLIQLYENVLTAEKDLSMSLMSLCIESLDLKDEFAVNAETHFGLSHNGSKLLSSLRSFVTSLTTFSDKIIGDVLSSWKGMEKAKISYDTHVKYLDHIQSAAVSMDTKVSLESKVNNLRSVYENKKSDYEVKVEFLMSNKLTVLKEILNSFDAAFGSYFGTVDDDIKSSLASMNLSNRNYRMCRTGETMASQAIKSFNEAYGN